MKKILINGILCLMITILLTGCNVETLKSNSPAEKSKGNCEALDCINLIEPENSIDEINKIIGLEGTLTDEKYNKYYWELSENTGIEVTYYSSDKGTISVDFEKNSIANKKVNFSKYSEIQSLLKSGTSLTYNEFVNKVGNVEGTLIEKSAYTKRYTWVNSDGGYLNASFSENTGKCTVVTGRY